MEEARQSDKRQLKEKLESNLRLVYPRSNTTWLSNVVLIKKSNAKDVH